MANWDTTQRMKKRLENRIEGNSYRGRNIIQRDSHIDGGVYLGAEQSEAVVVDSAAEPAILALYEQAKRKALTHLVEKEAVKRLVLKAVHDTVKEAITVQDEEAVRMLATHLHCENDGKVSLGVFINTHTGIDRHMALACGVLLELFKRDGFISGSPSIDRNAGLTWCRYTNSQGEVFILDAARGYVGNMRRATGLDYRRPDESR
ncbi:MAG TPA: hypothetical protein HA362_01850 [Nanoarchaeota archaeon]|nr:hypothetical protein [Nanoarchaeota archaeon]